MLMQIVFYVNNLTPSIINTKCTAFMPAHCVYSTNTPICVTLFPSPFNFQQYFLFLTKVFSFICFYWLFWYQFGIFLFKFNLIFVSFGYFLGPAAVFLCKVS